MQHCKQHFKQRYKYHCDQYCNNYQLHLFPVDPFQGCQQAGLRALKCFTLGYTYVFTDSQTGGLFELLLQQKNILYAFLNLWLFTGKGVSEVSKW